MGLANCGDQYLNKVGNQLTSGKLNQSTTLSIQCDRFSYPWTWCTQYFHWWPRLEKYPFIVDPIKCSQKIENQFTISFYIKLSYYLLLFSFCLYEKNFILYRYSFYTLTFQQIYSQSNILNKTFYTSYYHK